ncbi:MAG: WG repeat-containing protein [Fluviicola sp.]|nr:WG repeat-containing protein [Fluviicola sp.]
MIRLIVIAYFWLHAVVAFSQTELILDSLSYTTIVPYKTTNGWTFMDNWKLIDSFPIVDSVVVKPYTLNRERPFIIAEKNRFGLLYFSDHWETVLPATSDSVFQHDNFFFSRENSVWNVYSWDVDHLEKVKELGDVEKWFELGNELYFWKDHKMGMCKEGEFVLSDYQYIHYFESIDLVNPTRMSEEVATSTIYLVSDGEKFGLITKDQELIACKAKTIQPFSLVWCRYWEKGYWVYFRYFDGFEVDPKGKDIVFYSDSIWKIFNADRSRSEIYLWNQKMAISGQYEDYFLLPNGKLAVKNNQKVGVVELNGNQRVPIAFDQIDCLDNSFYRVLKGDKWFLADSNGTVLTKKGVDFILPFNSMSKSRFFEFHDKQLHGVFSDNGTVVLEANYQHVLYYMDCFIVYNYNGVGLFDSKGKALSSMEYNGYDFQDNYIVLFYSKDVKDVFNSKGKLTSKPCSEFVQLDDVLKFYSKNHLEIVALDEDRLTVFDRQIYTGDISFEIDGIYKDTLYHTMNFSHPKSHIEEHQLTGYFGLRENFSTKHVEQPNLLEILPGHSFNIHTGIVKHEEIPMLVDDSIHLIAFSNLQAFDIGAGNYVGSTFVSSTLHKYSYGTSTTANRLIYAPNGSKEWWASYGKVRQDASEINGINYNGEDVFAYHIGGTFKPIQANEKIPPLYENYQWYNDLNTIGIDPVSIQRIMDPTKGRELIGGKWLVQIDASFHPELINKALKNKEYSSLELDLSRGIVFNEASFEAKNTDDDLVIWNYQIGDSTPIYKYKDVIRYPVGFSTLVSAALHVGFVHPSAPDYIFDTIDNDFEFEGGRLIERKGDSTLLWSTDMQLIGSFGSGFYYLNNELFAAQKASKWFVYNRNGEQVGTIGFDKIQPFTDGLAIVENSDAAMVVNLKFEKVDDLPSTGFEAKSNGVYVLEQEAQSIYVDLKRKIQDTISNNESFLGVDWLFSRGVNKKYVRKIGSKKQLNVDVSPIVFGKGLICKVNGYNIYLNEDEKQLVTRKNKCLTIEKANHVVCFQSAKRWLIYNSKAQIIYDAPKGKSLNVLNGIFVVETKDTVFALDQSGNKYALDQKGNIIGYHAVSTVSNGETSEEVFEENGQFGVKSNDGEVILPAKFEAVLSKQNDMYAVKLPPQIGLGFYYPKEILTPNYDVLIPMDTQFVFVRKGQRTGVFSVGGEWFIPLH